MQIGDEGQTVAEPAPFPLQGHRILLTPLPVLGERQGEGSSVARKTPLTLPLPEYGERRKNEIIQNAVALVSAAGQTHVNVFVRFPKTRHSEGSSGDPRNLDLQPHVPQPRSLRSLRLSSG